MLVKAILKSSAVFCLINLAACQANVSEDIKPEVVEDMTVQAPATTMPTFADMVAINTPLGVVKGAYTPLPYEKVINNDLTKALDEFASASESYSVIVWHQGQIIYENYPEPYTADTRSESASMHKSVMALLVGTAIEDGFISGVDAEIGAYIPEWSSDPRGEIKIRDLLEMSSGLEPLSAEGGMKSLAVQFMMKGDQARQTILGMALADDPGSVFYYQNAASQILGLILENATGKSYQDYLSERLWQPIGASDAKVWFNEPEGFARTYTGLYAVARDWVRLGLLVKDNGKFGGKQVVPEDYVSKMTAPSRANVNYGWQIWRGETFEPMRFYNHKKTGFPVTAGEPFTADDILYFDGFGGQRVYISRSKDLVIVRTGNVRMDWDDTELPNLVMSKL